MSAPDHRLLSALCLAVASLIAAPGTCGGAPAAMRDLREGDRIGALCLTELHQGPQAAALASPTVVVFWATWAPSSIAALRDIVGALPGSVIRWDLVPINVDDPVPAARAVNRIDSVVRAAGYQGPVWFDKNFELSRQWGVVGLPAVVIVAYGGTVETITRGWAAPVRERVVAGYLGLARDTTMVPTPDSAAVRCRREAAQTRLLWERGKGDSAIATMRRSMPVCSDGADQWVFLARWCWHMGDSAAAQSAADSAAAVDPADPWGWATAGEFASWRGDLKRAQEYARRAISCDSTFAPGWGLLAWSALETGDDSTAERAAGFLQHYNRQDPRLTMVRARLWEEKGDLQRAAATWREAVGRRLRADRDPLTGVIRGDWLGRP